MLGWTLSLVPFVFMFAQIAGYEPLKYFWYIKYLDIFHCLEILYFMVEFG